VVDASARRLNPKLKKFRVVPNKLAKLLFLANLDDSLSGLVAPFWPALHGTALKHVNNARHYV